MLSFIMQIKRQFRDKYNFIPTGGTDREPMFDNIPDGTYPMDIEGKAYNIVVKDDKISIQ